MTAHEDLLEALLTTGIIQFGHFIDGEDESAPVRLQFELLPAYPQVLELAAEAVASRIKNRGLQRLVCDQDSLPLAVCAGQKTRTPLIYNRDAGLAGAYDVGHPAALIGNVYTPQEESALEVVKTRAARTGLNIEMEVYLLGLSQAKPSTAQSLITLDNNLLNHWVEQRRIAAPQRTAIQRWLEKQVPIHHPG